MPPYLTSSSQFLEIPKSHFQLGEKHREFSNSLEGEIGGNVPEFHVVPNLTVQTSAVSVFDQVSPGTMAKAQTKDSVLDWSFHMYIRGKNQRAQSFQKLDVKQYASTCFNWII